MAEESSVAEGEMPAEESALGESIDGVVPANDGALADGLNDPALKDDPYTVMPGNETNPNSAFSYTVSSTLVALTAVGESSPACSDWF